MLVLTSGSDVQTELDERFLESAAGKAIQEGTRAGWKELRKSDYELDHWRRRDDWVKYMELQSKRLFTQRVKILWREHEVREKWMSSISAVLATADKSRKLLQSVPWFTRDRVLDFLAHDEIEGESELDILSLIHI